MVWYGVVYGCTWLYMVSIGYDCEYSWYIFTLSFTIYARVSALSKYSKYAKSQQCEKSFKNNTFCAEN